MTNLVYLFMLCRMQALRVAINNSISELGRHAEQLHALQITIGQKSSADQVDMLARCVSHHSLCPTVRLSVDMLARCVSHHSLRGSLCGSLTVWLTHCVAHSLCVSQSGSLCVCGSLLVWCTVSLPLCLQAARITITEFLCAAT